MNALLEKIPPGGKEFVRAMQRVLDRENQWITWKKEGCPSFERGAVELREKPVQPPLPSAKKFRYLGDEELQELCASPDAVMDSLRSLAKPAATAEEALDIVKSQMDPEAMIDEDDRICKSTAFKWKAFRLLSRSRLSDVSEQKDIEGVCS